MRQLNGIGIPNLRRAVSGVTPNTFVSRSRLRHPFQEKSAVGNRRRDGDDSPRDAGAPTSTASLALRLLPGAVIGLSLTACTMTPLHQPGPPRGATLLMLSTTKESRSPTTAAGIRIVEQPDRLRVEVNGQPFTEYFFKDVPRPFCYPLLGPGGLPMTRNWPMKDTPGEDHDHKHHRSLWFTHGSINGHDFWSEDKDYGRIVHEGFTKVSSGNEGVIASRNRWIAQDGTVVCTDEETWRFYNRPANERLFDFEITLHASNGRLTFGDTKEGSMAVRLAETMRLKPNKDNAGKPTGHIVNSEGVRDEATWGKRAPWCDYYGPVEGKIVGIAIFDHPQNPRHPTWWHVRDYGLFAANPFGRHDFEKLPDKTAGNLVVPAGQSITFRYRFYVHEGDEKQSKVAEHYADYVKSAPKKSK